MAKFVMTSFQKKKHEKAFEFYAQVDALGKHRSNAIIGGMVGASPSAVAYWKRRDNWDGKLVASIEAEINEADLTNKNIKKLLRESLYNHIKSLNRVIEFSKNDGDKVTAIKAFVHIAKELACLDPETGGTDPASTPTFKDDLTNGPAEQASPRADGAGTPTDGEGSPVGSPSDLDQHPVSGSDPVFALPVAPDDPVHAGDHLDAVFKSAGL